MTTCDYCKEKIDGLPHACKYCGKVHCSKHLLPENHDCEGLKEYSSKNAERWKKNFSEIVSHKNKGYEENRSYSSKKQHTKKEQKRKAKPSEKIKYFFSDQFHNLKKWLIKRNHWEYNFKRQKKYLFKIILIFALSILGLFFFYSRADQFNQINLWIFNLGGLLVLTSLFFAIIYGWKFLKETHNFYKRQRKWIKIIVLFVLLILIWQVFANGQILTEKVKTSYNQIEFSLFSPLSLSKSPDFRGQEVVLPKFFINNSCKEINQYADNQYLNPATYKKDFCGAVCGQQNLEYQRYSCDSEDKFHCFCKGVKNE